MQLTLASLVRYTKISVTVLMVTVLVGVSWFLYRNFYQPLTQSILVAELRAKVARTTVDKQKLKNVLQKLQDRQQFPEISWETLPNIFSELKVELKPEAPTP